MSYRNYFNEVKLQRNYNLLNKISNNLRNYRKTTNKLRKEGNNFTKAVINVYRAKGRPASPQTRQRLYQPYLNLHKLNSNAYYKYMAAVRNLITKTSNINRSGVKNALSNIEKQYVRNYAKYITNKLNLINIKNKKRKNGTFVIPLPSHLIEAEFPKHMKQRPKFVM